MHNRRFLPLASLVTVFASLLAPGELQLPSIFSDGLILQQEKGAKIWGWTDKGDKVTVTFADQEVMGTADATGRWEVVLDGLVASSQPRALVVTSGQEKKTIENVLVGEVWLASGQSNMEWKVKHSDGAAEAIAAPVDPLLRVYITPNVAKSEVQNDFPGKWYAANERTTGNFPAVAYYFAHRLREELGCPVAIIECAWGGKPVEAFMSAEALQELPQGAVLLERKAKALAKWNPETAIKRFEDRLALWESDKKGRRPVMPIDPAEHPNYHSTIYQGMIAPLVGYTVRGALWYQGESNADEVTAPHYGELLTAMVADWRSRWQDPFSFYYVHLANFQKATSEPGIENHWVTVQDEQRRALATIPNSGMAVANDIGDADDIHPGNKHEVGMRLSRFALARDYNKAGVVTSGPLFTKGEVAGETMILSFEHSKGLKSRDGKPLQRFEIRSQEGPWQWAENVEIDGDRVVVSSPEVTEPFAVRYGWAQNPVGANLVNGAGLPASVFTTEEVE